MVGHDLKRKAGIGCLLTGMERRRGFDETVSEGWTIVVVVDLPAAASAAIIIIIIITTISIGVIMLAIAMTQTSCFLVLLVLGLLGLVYAWPVLLFVFFCFRPVLFPSFTVFLVRNKKQRTKEPKKKRERIIIKSTHAHRETDRGCESGRVWIWVVVVQY